MPVRLRLSHASQEPPAAPRDSRTVHGCCITQPDCATDSLILLLCLFLLSSPTNEQKRERCLFYLFIDSKSLGRLPAFVLKTNFLRHSLCAYRTLLWKLPASAARVQATRELYQRQHKVAEMPQGVLLTIAVALSSWGQK